MAVDALWRHRLFRLGEDEHVWAVTAHHAVFDGWSQAMLYDDLATAYAGAALPPLPATYGDYVAWRAERREQRADADLGWWTAHLDGAPTVLDVPGDRPRPAEQTYPAGYSGAWLDAETTAELHRFAREHGATPSAVLLAAFGLVLSSWAGQEELVLGTPAVDRRHPDFEPMVGFFVDITPLRLRTEPGVSFADHVRAARDELIAALAHPEAPWNAWCRRSGWAARRSAARWSRCCSTCSTSPRPGWTSRAWPASRCRCPRRARRST
ncbi:condensation domain-containing protein [Catellatospora coxensis]